MAAQKTFLQLAEEFGGHKFGPFTKSEIRVGSDDNNDIKIPARLGVLGQHLRIYQREDGSFVLAPAERTATVYWWRGEQRQPKLVDGPTACMAGDRFSLVTPDGPRFTLVREKVLGTQKAEAQQKAENFGKGMAKEVGRRAFASLQTNPLIRPLVNAGRFIKTGQWRSPVYILPALLSCTGVCSGAGAFSFARATQSELAQTRQERDTCLGSAGSKSGKVETPTVVNLTSKMLGGVWAQNFDDDGEFRELFVAALGDVFRSGDGYKVYYANEDSIYFQYREKLKASGMEASLIPVFASLVAVPNRFDAPGQEPSPRVFEVDGGLKMCGRGLSQLTWWQGTRFGVDPGLVARDVFFDMSTPEALATEGDEAATAAYRDSRMRAAFRVKPGAAIEAAPPPPTEDANPMAAWFGGGTVAAPAAPVGGWTDKMFVGGQAAAATTIPDFCQFENIAASDARVDLLQTANAVAKFSSNPKLPRSPASPYYGSAHLVSYFAAAWNVPGLWEGLTFNQTASPSLVLSQAYPDDGSKKAALKSLALNNAASALARTVGMVCFQALATESDKGTGKPILEGDYDPLVPCLIMRGLYEYGRAK